MAIFPCVSAALITM